MAAAHTPPARMVAPVSSKLPGGLAVFVDAGNAIQGYIDWDCFETNQASARG